MTFVTRAALREGLTAFVRASPAMDSLERAMRLLYRDRPRPSASSMAELVLLSIVRGHEVRTRSVLGRLNGALARILDDLDALRAGRSIEGRTAGLRTQDLTTIAQAMEELRTLEQQVRFLLDGDESWAAGLRAELSAALAGPRAPIRPPARPLRPAALGRPRPPARQAAARDGLRRALLAAADDPDALVARGELPGSVRRAAHSVVVAAGGDVALAVRGLLDQGGPEADAMVKAVLIREGRLRPGARLEVDAHEWARVQQQVTGLDFEWASGPGGARRPVPGAAPLPEGTLGHTIGIDDISGGRLLDVKTGTTPVEARIASADYVPFWRRDVEPGVDVEIREATRPRGPSELELQREEVEVVNQMARQIVWAENNGLRGVTWECTSTALADAYRLIAEGLPRQLRDRIGFVVGAVR